MIYRLLGKLEIGPDDQSLDLPRGNSLRVLATLLLNANQRMSKQQLLKAAWGRSDVSEAQLHKAVAALRAELAKIGRGNDLVTHSRFGYELRVSDSDLDILLFKRLSAQAEQARSQHRVEDEISLLREGLELWRGHRPLANLPDDAFRPEVHRLEQRRKRAAVRLFDLELARHDYERVLDDLAVVAGYYPDDGRLTEQLMIAQYRCGHLTDATAAYERHAAALADQTGGDPVPALRALYYAMAADDEAVIADAEAAAARRCGMFRPTPREAEAAIPRQLPPDPADFIGRDELVAEASWLLGRPPGRAVPVVVISGPGGIGKTALACRVAHQLKERYPDGQLYAELSATASLTAETSEVLAQFLRSFGVSSIPEGRAERVAAYRTLLASRRVLVVLDDAADEAQIGDLIPGDPGSGVLVTARLRLPGISGAHHLPPLSPLTSEMASRLFLRVCANSGIDLEGELDEVERVAALCGGLPLALRIAGALQVHEHPQPTADLADRLAWQGPEALTYRELSVARTISATLERLDAEAQQLFLRFGLLRLPSFGIWTAAALHGGSSAEAAETLSRLAARYMLEPAEPGTRYRFHDLTREYAARLALTERPEEDERRSVLGQAYGSLLTLARRAHASLYGGDFEVVHSAVPDWDAPSSVLAGIERDPLGWFEQERLNIRAAISHCAEAGLTDICWDLAVSAHEFYTLRGYFDDWHATHQVALRACQDAGERRGEGIVLTCLGQPALAASRREGVPGPAELQRALSLLADCGDQHGAAIALRTLANALCRRGQLARPLTLFQEALGGYEASGDRVGRWLTLRYIGQALLELGRFDEALLRLQAAEKLADGLGKPRLIAQTQYWAGQARLAADDLDGAQDSFSAVLEAYPEPSNTGHAYAILGLAGVGLRAGKLSMAEGYLSLAAELAHDGGDAGLEGRAHMAAAEVQAARGQRGRQVSALERAVACFTSGDTVYLRARALFQLAGAQTAAGDDAAARATRDRIADLYEEMDLPVEDRVHRELS